MKSREWFEDSIQSILAECLPQLPKSNIRPAYSKSKSVNLFASNYVDSTDQMKNGVKSVKNTDDFVYFWLHFDPIDMLTTEISNTISTIVPMRLTISVYGRNSMPIAIRLKAFLRTEDVLYRMLGMQATLGSDPNITTFPEEIQGEWWERNDLDVRMDVLVNDLVGGADAAQFSLGEGEGFSTATNGEVLVEGVS